MHTMALSVVIAICLIALADALVGPGVYECLGGERALVNSNKDSYVCTNRGKRVMGSEVDLQTTCNVEVRCSGYEYRHKDNYGYLCNNLFYEKWYLKGVKKCCGAKLCKKVVVGQCPLSHPYAYRDGDYCCASNREKEAPFAGRECDGGIISLKSGCCKDDRYKRCKYPTCKSYQVERECPRSHPFVYRNGKYCCKYNREKVYRPEGSACDGGTIGYSSTCCKDDAHISCPGDICVSFRGRDTPYEDMRQYKYTFEDEPRKRRQHAVADIYIDIQED